MTHPYLTGPRPRAFAHRGWHVDDLTGMENSLSSFRRAVQEGYRYIETDVHATSDGHVVVHHDQTLDRTTDAQGVVSALPWTEVQHARVGGREPIARLADVLEELPDTFFNIDVKSENAVEPIITLLRKAGSLHRVCLASFSDNRLARLRKLAGPGLLTSMGPRSAGALWAAGRIPLAGLAVRGQVAQVPVSQGRLQIVDRRFVQAAHRRSLEVHVWTVDDEADMRTLLDLGVDGLVTDRPDVLREVLQSRNSW
ncbi:glycerophosphodiester phosphodiesterase [Lentzea flaviverrucosa]|uniref:Glycerophosphoryl diester phosphodiesterase n=1 Tax=Lentzea flaviverrucosa TaxID=200379 RepID=A0A1H9AGK5_9PSEU|nr:glycerophosphodiester phosphodiesterase [Lentzea flaviverrucosa]RDI32073.1 glycerophosphoryl diester phosphodiesterase [Lentzea flaviverrucosa]SEP75641.1 glycerophosphoryl diester phosphodiesterase [Lentzea flaviverrucosa]